ncbi:hypothetical protein G6F56_000443 [Rhizopus delemar]|nr:hypothetical protein G6F56_000443 [Rhizopus delemar]
MSENILFRDGTSTIDKWPSVQNCLCAKTNPFFRLLIYLEVASSVLKVANEENVVMWKNIVREMAELIQQNYKGGRVKLF